MAISERIKAEARRTIDRMQQVYEKFSDDVNDAEELEHRIARVEASMEGCNGLSQEDKIQKTAENVFELTCAQERSYDALRLELKRNRDEYKSEFADLRTQNAQDFDSLRQEIKEGLESVMKKIEDSGMDSTASMIRGNKFSGLVAHLISAHPALSSGVFLAVLVLVFISGHFQAILDLFASKQ